MSIDPSAVLSEHELYRHYLMDLAREGSELRQSASKSEADIEQIMNERARSVANFQNWLRTQPTAAAAVAPAIDLSQRRMAQLDARTSQWLQNETQKADSYMQRKQQEIDSKVRQGQNAVAERALLLEKQKRDNQTALDQLRAQQEQEASAFRASMHSSFAGGRPTAPLQQNALQTQVSREKSSESEEKAIGSTFGQGFGSNFGRRLEETDSKNSSKDKKPKDSRKGWW